MGAFRSANIICAFLPYTIASLIYLTLKGDMRRKVLLDRDKNTVQIVIFGVASNKGHLDGQTLWPSGMNGLLLLHSTFRQHIFNSNYTQTVMWILDCNHALCECEFWIPINTSNKMVWTSTFSLITWDHCFVEITTNVTTLILLFGKKDNWLYTCFMITHT